MDKVSKFNANDLYLQGLVHRYGLIDAKYVSHRHLQSCNRWFVIRVWFLPIQFYAIRLNAVRGLIEIIQA